MCVKICDIIQKHLLLGKRSIIVRIHISNFKNLSVIFNLLVFDIKDVTLLFCSRLSHTSTGILRMADFTNRPFPFTCVSCPFYLDNTSSSSCQPFQSFNGLKTFILRFCSILRHTSPYYATRRHLEVNFYNLFVYICMRFFAIFHQIRSMSEKVL